MPRPACRGSCGSRSTPARGRRCRAAARPASRLACRRRLVREPGTERGRRLGDDLDCHVRVLEPAELGALARGRRPARSASSRIRFSGPGSDRPSGSAPAARASGSRRRSCRRGSRACRPGCGSRSRSRRPCPGSAPPRTTGGRSTWIVSSRRARPRGGGRAHDEDVRVDEQREQDDHRHATPSTTTSPVSTRSLVDPPGSPGRLRRAQPRKSSTSDRPEPDRGAGEHHPPEPRDLAGRPARRVEHVLAAAGHSGISARPRRDAVRFATSRSASAYPLSDRQNVAHRRGARM